MPVRSIPRRSAPARRRRATRPARAGMSYRQTRATIAVLGFVLAFGFLWLFNGDLTAKFVMMLTGKDATWGWAAHLIITLVEVAPALLAPYLTAIPRRVVVVLWLISLPFGVFDVVSSAVGIDPYFRWVGFTGLARTVQNVVLAEIIGFAPERMIMWLLVALRAVLKDNGHE